MKTSLYFKSLAPFLLVALPFLIYFHFSFRHYPEKSITLAGTSDVENVLTINWNTRGGFSAFEVNETKIPQGDFSVKIDLPYDPIHSIRIEPKNSANIKFKEAQLSLDGHSIKTRQPLSHKIPLLIKTPGFTSSKFSPLLFCLQTIFSLFCSYCIFALKSWFATFGKSSLKEILRAIFMEDGRLSFWIFLVISMLVHILWLLAYWPAWMTYDSWITMRDIQHMVLTDWHPYVYTLYVLFFLQFYNSVASVVFGQIFLTALLFSGIFFYCLKKGTPRWIVWIFFIYFTCSVPIGLFNLMIWKDIPYSIAVAGFSFSLFYLAQKKKETGIKASAFPGGGVFFILLLTLLIHTRHNGKIFYLLAPLLLTPYLHRSLLKTIIGAVIGMYLILQVALPSFLNIAITEAAPYQEFKTALFITTHYNYFSKDRERDIKIIEEASGVPWSTIKEKFPQHWFPLWDSTKLAALMPPHTGYTKDYNKAFLARIVKDNLSIFLAARTFDFLHSIGLDSSQYNAWTNYFENPTQYPGTNLKPPGYSLVGVFLASEPVNNWLHDIFDKISEGSRYYDGGFSISVIIWNLAGWIIIMLGVCLLTEFSHPIKLFIAPVFFSSLGVFLAGAGESWRYFYYIYLAGIVTIPLFIASIKGAKNEPPPC